MTKIHGGYIILFLFVVVIGLLYFSSQKANYQTSLNPLTSIKNQNGYLLALSQADKEKLIQIVQTNKEAQDLFQKVKRNADKALSQEPSPINLVQSSHLINADQTKQLSLQSAKDMPKVYALGFAFAITGDQVYAQKAKQYILAWAKINKPTNDPINERLFEPLFMGYDLTKTVFTETERQQTNEWLLGKSETLINGINPKGTSAINNHNSHLLNVVGMIGYVTGNQKTITYAINGYKKQISQDLNPDGSSYDFHQRDALYYHVFTLEPLLNLARIAQMNGTELFSYQSKKGSSLQKSLNFLMPYINGQKKHEEWINSTAPFDKQRAAAGEPEFQPGVLFQPKEAYEVLELYYYFNPKVLPLILKLSNTNSLKYPDFMLIYIDSLLS